MEVLKTVLIYGAFPDRFYQLLTILENKKTRRGLTALTYLTDLTIIFLRNQRKEAGSPETLKAKGRK